MLIASVFNFIIWENQSDLITRNQQLIAENQSVKLRQSLVRQVASLKDKRSPDAYGKAADAARADGVA